MPAITISYRSVIKQHLIALYSWQTSVDWNGKYCCFRTWRGSLGAVGSGGIPALECRVSVQSTSMSCPVREPSIQGKLL